MNDFSQGYLIEGYTRVTTKTHDGTKLILYAHPNFQGKKWYDWAYIHFEELNSGGEAIETYYSSKILGFVTIHGITEAVIQCSEKPCHRPPRYVLYRGTFVPYDGTYGAPDQGQTLDV